MINAIVIPAELSAPLHQTQLDPCDGTLSRLVGGNFQVISFDGPPASLYLNEQGKLLNLPFNPRATAMTWVHNSAFRGRDVIVGDAVLLGGVDRNANDSSVPEHYLRLLFEATLLGVEVQCGGQDTWRPLRGVALAAQSSAYLLIADFAHRTPAVDEIRLVVIPDPEAHELIARSTKELATALAELAPAAAAQ